MHYPFILFLITLLWLPGLHSQELVDPGAEIQVTDIPQDRAIEKRLTDILAVIESYEDVKITVNAGVVSLTGTVPSARAGRDLVTLASRVEGVIYVQNLLSEQMDISTRVKPTTQQIQELFADLLQRLPIVLVAIFTLILFGFIGHWAGQRSGWLRRLGFSELAADLGNRIIRIGFIGIGLLIALQILDATALVGALLGVAGLFGLAVGFAFRNIVENYLAGILLSARNPFQLGDAIQIGEFTGNVVRLTSRDTVLMTGEGNHLRIPNSTMITSVMTNYSRNPLRRFDFTLAISAKADVLKARHLAMTILQQMKGILTEPPVQILITDIRDNTVELHFMAWINQHESDFAKARSEALRLVKSGFDQAQIKMPEPVSHVQLVDQPTILEPQNDTNSVEKTDDNMTAAPVDPGNVDIAADATMKKQLANELQRSDEENLLK